MNYEAILILALVCTLAPAFIYPLLAAQDDAIEIELNGSYDTLKKPWHRNSAFIRVLVFGSLAGYYLVLGALAGDTGLGFSAAVSYGVFTAALFWAIFDMRLARLRDKDLGYVSQQPDAAYADQVLVLLAQRLGLNTPAAGILVRSLAILVNGIWYGVMVYRLATI